MPCLKKDLSIFPTPIEFMLNNCFHDSKYELICKEAFRFFLKTEVTFLYEQKKIVIGNLEEILQKLESISQLITISEEEFFDFYNNPTLTVEEIVEKRYTQADLPQDINEKFACIAGLLDANENQVAECREFIRKYCDPEYLSVYDMYWVGNDEKRMEKLAELEEISMLKDEGGLNHV